MAEYIVIKKFNDLMNVDETDKYESQYTIITKNMKVSELKTNIYSKLEAIKKIKNGFKRKHINNKLYSIIEYLNECDDDNVKNEILLVGKKIYIYKLTKKNISILNLWQVDDFILLNGDNFKLDYVNELLTDGDFYDVIYINNMKMTHSNITLNKKRIVKKYDSVKNINLNEYIGENINKHTSNKGFCVIHGLSSILKTLEKILEKTIEKQNNILIFNKKLTKNEILFEIEKHKMKDIHEKINECFDNMKNEKMDHRIKIGKDLVNAIKYSTIKTVYCTEKMFNRLKKNFSKDLLNFEIIISKSFENGDPVDILEKNFKGIIGVTYY